MNIGDKLRKARERAGVTQQIAAKFLDLPRTAITQLELGNRSVSTLELSKLAELYCCPIAYFFEAASGEDDVLVTLYRMAPGLTAHPGVKKQVDLYISWCREGLLLEQLLGRNHRFVPPSYSNNAPKNASEAISQGEEVAMQERKRLGIGLAPIADMSDLINEQNIWASGVDLPDNMSGLFIFHNSIGLAIFVNAGHSRARKRFSYAHEYAHALLDRSLNIAVSSSYNASELVEKRANAFAAAFLMPSEGVATLLRNLDKGKPSKFEKMVFNVATEGYIDVNVRPITNSQLITYQDIALIAHHFGVSYQAAIYRLKSLGHIVKRECDELLAKENIGREYLKALDMLDDLEEQQDKKFCNRELRSHIVQLAIEAYRREEISRGKLLDISKSVDISADIMLSLANAARIS